MYVCNIFAYGIAKTAKSEILFKLYFRKQINGVIELYYYFISLFTYCYLHLLPQWLENSLKNNKFNCILTFLYFHNSN